MTNVSDIGRRNAKTQKRGRNATLQTCSKRRKKLVNKEMDEESTFDATDLTLSSYKKQLIELADKDPKFYKFLKEQESDLLHFDESDSDVEEDPHHERADNESKKSEENESLNRDSTGRKVIDMDFVTNLQNSFLQKERLELPVIHQMVAAFTACVARVGADIEPPCYVINDSNVFERVVRLCFTYLGKSLLTLMDYIKSKADDESDSKFKKARKYTKKQYRCWKKHGNLIKSYLHALLQFLNEIQTSGVTVCTLRAVTDLLELYIHFPKLTRSLAKAIIKIWSRRTDECRIAAFLALSKLIRIHKDSFPTIIKRCYLEYVMNVRDVKAESWFLIILMQKSFAELCMTYPEIAYQYTFVYIRQMAIHLRNAMIAKRKDLIQTVYNWQFMQCLYLWSHVIAKAHSHISNKKEDAAGIKELDYPLCQIAISTMKLFPSLKYFPLRLHCLRILLIIQQNCHTYIPTLSLAVELLSDALLMLKKKPIKGKEMQKNIDMRCTLKVSAAHIDDAGFREAALEELFRIHLEAAHIVQHSFAFADIVIPINHEIKVFVKNCRNTEFSRLFKSLETKLQEQTAYARGILNSTDVDLTNESLVKHLERRFQAADAPLTKFYDSWQKMWKLKEDAKNLMDTKRVQQPSHSNPEQDTTPAMKMKIAVVTKADKVGIKMNNVRRTMQKPERSNLINEGDEDVLEDLMLSDAED
ncbi:Noc2p family protein [Acanthocheilonema viteae]